MLIVWSCFVLGSHLYSQQTALFQATIQVEDAMGNKDSVVIGYDSEATYDIDPDFGEAAITTPFDSVLEVRAMSALSFNNALSKVIIEYGQFIPAHNCHSGPLIFIYVWSKYQPITVSWDSAYFLNNVCIRGSFLSNHQIDEVTGPFDLDGFPPICACMANQSFYTFELTAEALSGLSPLVGIQREVEGLGVQAIYGLRFKPHMAPDYTPCYWITTDTEEHIVVAPLAIFPNPSHGLVKIVGVDGASFDEVMVFDAMGQLVHIVQRFIPSDEVDLSRLPRGIYQLQAHEMDGMRYIGRVVKL